MDEQEHRHMTSVYVCRARALAIDIDPRAYWDLFGVVGVEGRDMPGILNERLGL